MHAVITGANDGIGLETARGLARLGIAKHGYVEILRKLKRPQMIYFFVFPR